VFGNKCDEFDDDDNEGDVVEDEIVDDDEEDDGCRTFLAGVKISTLSSLSEITSAALALPVLRSTSCDITILAGPSPM
jgi:hypothetical protein